MSYHIKDWVLEGGFEHYETKDGQKAGKKILPNLSKINIFVGANNSGKSRFMRKLASQSQVYFAPNFDSKTMSANFAKLSENKDSFLREINEFLKSRYITKLSVLEKINEFKESLEFLSESVDTNVLQRQLENIESNTISDTGMEVLHQFSGSKQQIMEGVKSIAARYKQILISELKDLPKKYKFQKVYIPTLRGLRTYENISNPTSNRDIYGEKTLKDYFVGIEAPPDIFTGLTMYKDIHDLLTGAYHERKSIAKFEEFISDSFFNGRRVTLIPSKEGVLFVKIGEEKELPIQHLGDGIQSIIILTFPLFKNKGAKLLVFFEEPELYMHPGIQRIFLEVLNRFPDYQYFLTTHSNHFLDITIDLSNVSVFTFHKELENSDKDEKEAKIKIENVSNEDSASLQFLGVRNSSVFLSNCTIWVEGITDRHYFSKYLELYQSTLDKQQQQYKEDLHFSFVEYGGSNITHWSFLDDGEKTTIDVDRLCGKLFLITDKDSASDAAKAKRHEKLRTKLGDRYYCLESREIENLLTPKVIAAIVKQYEVGETEFKEFVQDSYKSELLGKFIESDVLKNPRKRKGSYASESGTISDKVNFCNKAIEQIKSFSDLSPEAQDITKRLFEFIKEHNL